MELQKFTPAKSYVRVTSDHQRIVFMLEKKGFNIAEVRDSLEKLNQEKAEERDCNGISISSLGSYGEEDTVFCVQIHKTFTVDMHSEFYRIIL